MNGNATLTWRHLVNWQRQASLWGLVLGLPLLIMATYYVTCIQVGVAKGTATNWAVTGTVGAIATALLLVSMVSTWRATGSVVPMDVDRQRALATIAATCLMDPSAMDLLQRLAGRLGGETDASAGDTRTVPQLLTELERRMRTDIAQGLMKKAEV